MTGEGDRSRLTRAEEFERPHLRGCESWLCGHKGRVTASLEAELAFGYRSRTNALKGLRWVASGTAARGGFATVRFWTEKHQSGRRCRARFRRRASSQGTCFWAFSSADFGAVVGGLVGRLL